MFSDNNRISGRQAFRILTYDLLGAGSLLVPGILANRAGCDGIFSIGLAVVFALFYVKVLSGVLADKKQDTFGTYLERRLGKVAGKTVSILYVVYFILLAGYVAYHFTNIILKYLLREESFLLILFILVLLAVYGLSGGLEGRARAYEILFWFVMAPLFLMLLSALDEISVDYWTPVVTAAPLSVLGGAWEVFCWLSLVFLLLFLGGSVKKTADTGACRAVGSAFCRHFICGAVSDSARNLWKKYALRDGISGGHNDEHDKNNRRLFKEDRCFHACHLVFHAVCTAWRHGILRRKSAFGPFREKIGVGRKIWIFHSCGGICAGRSFLSLKNTLHVL